MTDDRIDASRREVRKFGLTFGVLCIAAAAVVAYRGHHSWPWLLAAACAFTAAGLFAWTLLRPVYVAWMTFARALAWINTRVLLGIFFYLVLTPAGLAARALGKDLLEEKFDRAAPTYWKRTPAPPAGKSGYEHLF